MSKQMVVSTRSPKSDKQYVWVGEANTSSYTIREETNLKCFSREEPNLHCYHPERITNLVKNYSQFVSFQIYTWQEKGLTKEVEVDGDPAEGGKMGEDVNVENYFVGSLIVVTFSNSLCICLQFYSSLQKFIGSSIIS